MFCCLTPRSQGLCLLSARLDALGYLALLAGEAIREGHASV